VGIDFIDHFDMELVAGRSYSREFPSDSTSALVVNEAAARQYGYANPADIVGKKFDQWGRAGEVIGVVKDFNFISLHRKIEPLTLPFEAYASRFLTLKIQSDDMVKTIAEVEKIWKGLAPHRPFLYSFLDEDFDKQYQADFKFRKYLPHSPYWQSSLPALDCMDWRLTPLRSGPRKSGSEKYLGQKFQVLSPYFPKILSSSSWWRSYLPHRLLGMRWISGWKDLPTKQRSAGGFT
jgi:hypothetical protein